MLNLNGKALPSVAGRLRDAVPAMVSRGAVEWSVAGGERRGEAVVDGRDGEVPGWEVGDRRVGSGGRLSASRRRRSSEAGVSSSILGSDCPV